MAEDDINWDEEFADDPDYQALSPEQRHKLLAIMEKMIDKGLAAVYGDEDADTPDAQVDCARFVADCKTKCCTLIFARTKDEVAPVLIQHNPRQPYFIAPDEDGDCPHMDWQTSSFTIWAHRPLRCQCCDCRYDKHIWPEGMPLSLENAFPSLAAGRKKSRP